MESARLVIPTPLFADAMRNYLRAVAQHDESLPFDPTWDADDETFARYINNLSRGYWTTQEVTADVSFATHYWLIIDGEVFGQCTLRSQLNGEFGETHGHIGYGVHPDFRNRGYATFMVQQLLSIARTRGMDSVMITCSPDNAASRRVIEKCGGVMRDTYQGAYVRYDIPLLTNPA